MAPVFGYWDIRGLAEQCRLLLHYVGIEFEDKRYSFGPAPHFSSNEWLSDKLSLGLDFPNLPYYIDGDVKLTQSSAILEYIAEKHGMVPNCPKQRAVLQMLQNEVYDIRVSFGYTCYSPEFEKLRVGFLEKLSEKLQYFETYLGEKKWLTGDKINYTDFALCELLSQLVKFEPTCLEKCPKLRAYLSRFEDLPSLSEYMCSKEFKTKACTAASAKWRGDN